MRIRIIGAPLDMAGGRRGTDMGPSAIRYAGLGEKLAALGYTVVDEGNIAAPQPETHQVLDHRLRYLEPIASACEQIAVKVEQVAQELDLPLIIGGDHSVAIGSISGVVKAQGPLGVIWLDAHGDFNTHETTPSGNIHGMPLAVVNGFGTTRLLEIGGKSPKVKADNVALIGIRLIDDGERELLHESGIHVFSMEDIDRHGIAKVMTQALAIASSDTRGVHVSLDMDVVDPSEAPGVGTPVRGGMTYREAHLAMELIADSGTLRSMDVVEVNPILDQHNKTADLAVELILSALGKTIY